MFTEGYDPSPASTLRTTVRRGYKLARPPGGRELQPVVNCKKALRSSGDISTSTLTNLRNPGLKQNKMLLLQFPRNAFITELSETVENISLNAKEISKNDKNCRKCQNDIKVDENDVSCKNIIG